MSKVITYHCDRCGKETKTGYNISLEGLFGYSNQYICKECRDSFRKWWRDEKN